MKIVFTAHALEKFKVINKHGWHITKLKVRQTVRNPRWRGTSRFGQETAINLLNHQHILRVIIEKENDIIEIITFHPAKRGKYESTLQQN